MNDKSIGEKITDFAHDDEPADEYDRQIADAIYLAVQLGEMHTEFEGPRIEVEWRKPR